MKPTANFESSQNAKKNKFKVFRNFPLVVVLVIFELLPTFVLCEFKFKLTACSREIILCFFVYKFVRSSLIFLFKLYFFICWNIQSFLVPWFLECENK